MRYEAVFLDIDGAPLRVDLEEAPEATFVLPGLNGLPGIVEG